MAANRSHEAGNSGYIYGNAVRKNVQILEDPRKDPIQKLKEEEQRERARSIAQAERMSLVYVLFLAAAAVILVCICYQFLKMQTDMNKNVAEISSLQVQLEDMKAENDFQLSRIKESVDLNEIRSQAEAMGMVDASDSQVVHYTYGASDYVRQYANVPDGEKSSVLEYFKE